MGGCGGTLSLKLAEILGTVLPSKIPRPASVDDGVHARIDPSEPSDDGDDSFRIVNARLTECRQQIGDEERQPTCDEHAHHDTQRPVFIHSWMEFLNF